jgi:benzoate-CoA ligase family protein
MPDAREPFNLKDYFVGGDRLSEIGHRVAIEFDGRQITYSDLRGEINRCEQALVERGVNAGDRVAILLHDSPNFVASFLAVISLGAISVPINTFLRPEQVRAIIADSGARLTISERSLIENVATPDPYSERLLVDGESRPDAAGRKSRLEQSTSQSFRDTPAFLLYTSGSTGEPKGVLHLHRCIPFTVESYCANVLKLNTDDRIYSASRMFFAYGLGNSLSFPLATGATVLLERERPTAEGVARIFEERRPTVFFGVPAIYRALLDFAAKSRPIDTSSLRLCISAGEALPQTIFTEWWDRFGMTILDGIGSTEMLHIFISNRADEAREGSSGRVVEGYDARLLGDTGEELRGEGTGNLWMRGGSATAGYWRRPELTQQTIDDGWVRTGDVYRRDVDEFYYHLGRSDDCFKVNGLWVSPIEVEAALLSHEAVADAAVISSVNGAGLATVRAFIVIRSGDANDAFRDDIRAHVASRLAQYKAPSEIEFIAEMPRTSTGKVQRFKLREQSKGERTDGR